MLGKMGIRMRTKYSQAGHQTYRLRSWSSGRDAYRCADGLTVRVPRAGADAEEQKLTRNGPANGITYVRLA